MLHKLPLAAGMQLRRPVETQNVIAVVLLPHYLSARERKRGIGSQKQCVTCHSFSETGLITF